MKLTKKEACRLLIWYQELATPRSLIGKQGVKEYFNKVGSIQYDPLNTVGYNPNIVLQSRVKNYKPSMLTELLYKDHFLVDGWDKCMSIYKRNDWCKFNRVRERVYVNSPKYNNDDIINLALKVKELIKEKGPISSKELDLNEKVNWFWGEANIARAALEYLFYKGEIIVHHKIGTRKYYDLLDNQISREQRTAADPNKTEEQYYSWYVNRRVRSIGFLWNKAGDAWLGIKGLKSKERQESFNHLVDIGELVEFKIENISYSFYMPKESLMILDTILNDYPKNKKVSFIAPLDNFIWDRKLILELFSFNYKWEVYTPASKRKHGYYVLPVLYGDKFIARFEPKYNSKTRQLIINGWWWEENIKPNKAMKTAITRALKDFSKYLGSLETIGYEKI